MNINELLKEKEALETSIKHYNKMKNKALHIRNLQIFTNTCNFLIPYILSGAIIVCSFKLLDFGYPFIKDEITKTKTRSLEYKTNGEILDYSEYKKRYFNIPKLPSSYLIITTPLIEENGKWIRYIKEYQVQDIASTNLINAIIENNYYYFENNLVLKSEEKITSSYKNDNNDFTIDASIHYIMPKDTINTLESSFVNNIITSFEILCGLILGNVGAYIRKFDYMKEINVANQSYRLYSQYYVKKKKELENINNKMLNLIKKGK